jgi:hypothetical protein
LLQWDYQGYWGLALMTLQWTAITVSLIVITGTVISKAPVMNRGGMVIQTMAIRAIGRLRMGILTVNNVGIAQKTMINKP